VAVAYAVVAWLLMQIATQVFPFLQIPDWTIRLVIVLLALGFPIALVIAWAFELTPEGLKRTETAEALPPRKQSHASIYLASRRATQGDRKRPLASARIRRSNCSRLCHDGGCGPGHAIARALPFRLLSPCDYAGQPPARSGLG
jgi:hypothetical protein